MTAERETRRRAPGRGAAAAFGVFLALLGLYVYTSPGRIDMIDGQFRYEVARNWLDRGQPVILDPTLVPIGLSVMTRHGVYAVYNAAASVMAMPPMLVSRLLPGHTVERERFAFSMVGPVFGAALGGLLVTAYTMLGLPLARAVAWALVACLATMWWPGSTTIFDQNQQAVWLVLALLLAWESSRRGRVWPAALGGLAGAVLLNYQESYALVLPLVGLAVASTVPGGPGEECRLGRTVDRGSIVRYAAFGLTASVGLVGLVGFNYLRFGAPVYTGRYYDPLIFGLSHPVAALIGLFLSPGKSVFLFSPPLVLCLAGARRLFGRAPGLAAAIGAATIVHVLVVMQLVFFGGDWCWGPRYLLVLIPMWALALPFAVLRVRRWLLTGLVSAGVLVQVLGVSLDHQRFFLERNLAAHFWAVDPWFYVRNSQLAARVSEIRTTWREGIPRQAILWSPTPRGEVTYSLFGLPPGRHGYSSNWIRRFQVFYLPRPWPFWIATLDPARQPIEPLPWILVCAAAMSLGAGITWRAARGSRGLRVDEAPEGREPVAVAGFASGEGGRTGLTPGARRAAIGLGCGALVALPFLSVQFPPVADLPQHVAQVRLFWEALGDPGGPYRIQWLTPYGLAYVVFGAVWGLVSPENAGRFAMLAIGLLWVAAGHLLAAARGRSAAAAVLASALLFNHTLYWGFSSFAIGWPVFAGWLLLTSGRRAHGAGWADMLGLLAGAALLYASHALWLAVGTLWFLAVSASNRVGVRTAALRLASFSPVLIVAALWYPKLAVLGFDSPTRWFATPSGRLSASWLVEAVLGGLRGPAEYLALAALLGWVGLGLYQHRRDLPAMADRELLLAAALLACLAFLLPDLRTNTVAFAKRWAPCAAVLLILGAPAPRWRPSAQYAAAFALLVAVVGITTAAWVELDRREFSGLAASLRALPERPRVIGLDLARESELVRGRPFIQTFAYAQVLRGGELNFSFADFAPSPVVYKTRRKPTWTWGLEWHPERVRRSDLDAFDYALVNADEATHRKFIAHFGIAPALTDQGRWRLYRLRAS